VPEPEAAPEDELELGLELADDAFDEPLELLALPELLLELDELPEELCPLELELFPLEPLPLLELEPLDPEPELRPELLPEPDDPLPPSFANRGVTPIPSDNTAIVQTIDFLNFNMMIPLKKIDFVLEPNNLKHGLLTVAFRFVCDIFPRTIEVYVGIYPSSIICVKYSRKIVLKCNLTAFDNQHDTD
jgi:hypothetical protein